MKKNIHLRWLCRFWLLLIGLGCQSMLYAQDHTVSGIITDERGAPLSGASIKVAKTNRGVASDDNGRFTIRIDAAKATLEISMTGYAARTVQVKAGDDIRISLKESLKELNEVVVVGYGSQRRAKVVGAVAQLNGDELKKAPAMNVTNMLAGRLPGLTTLQQSGRPGADDATLRIRGVGTTQNASPMILIDNIERPSFAHLDPSEIESITILKDAVSTAVYGLQAANGIILITTKRGKNQRPTVTYDGALTVNQNTRFPKFLNGPDYMEWYNKGTEMDNEYNIHTNTNPVPLVYTQEQIDAVRNGTNTNPLLGNTDWVGMLLDNNSLSQQHSVGIRGGTDKVRYYTTFGMLDQDGIVANTGFQRYNLRSNLDAELNKYLSVSVDVGLRQTNTRTPGIAPDNTAYLNPFYQAVRTLPNLPMYAPNGLPTAYRSNAGWVNPIASVEKSGYQRTQSNIFQGNMNFNVKIPGVEGLTGKLLLGYDKTGTEGKSWLTPYTVMGRDRDVVVGDFVEINTLPGITRNTLRQNYSQNFRKTLQGSLSYDRSFGDHSISALALYEWSQAKNSVFSTGASNFDLTDIHEIDYGSKDPLYFVSPTGSSNVTDSRAGIVGRVNYSYLDKYLLEVAVRSDASVLFAEEYRWNAFPGVGAGWVISKENFFDNLSNTVNFLKIRASIGSQGNGKIGSYSFPYLSTFSLTTSPVVVIGGKPTNALYTNALANPKLKWETAVTRNVGFEAILWDGLLGVDFDWFYKHTRDILTSAGSLYPLSYGGYFPSVINHNRVANKGFDLQLRHKNKIGELDFGLTGNLNWAKNKILRLNESDGIPAWQRRLGRSVGEKIGFVVEGMYQTWEETANAASPSAGVVAPGFFIYKDINGDGRLTRADDMTYIGRSNLPELMFGLNIDLRYKGFDFSALIQGAALCDVSLAGTYEGSSGTSGVDDNTPFTKTFYGYGNSPYFLVENAWTPDNPNAEFPRLTAYKSSLSAHNAHINSGWIRDGSYVRLKSVQLGYTLPASWIRAAKIQNVRLYVSGFNLITLDKLKYLDPEMPNVNNGFYPQQRMFSGGISVTF